MVKNVPLFLYRMSRYCLSVQNLSELVVYIQSVEKSRYIMYMSNFVLREETIESQYLAKVVPEISSGKSSIWGSKILIYVF